MSRHFKFEIGESVQVSPKANTKHAGKFGTVKSRQTGTYWTNHQRSYKIEIADGGTSDLVEKSILKATKTQVATQTPVGAKKDHMVISPDNNVVGRACTFGEAVELAKSEQLRTPSAEKYLVVKIVTATTAPKTIVEMKDC